MNACLDFLTAATPWILIGLCIACLIVKQNLSAKDQPLTGWKKALFCSPCLCFFILGIIDYADPQKSGSTWIILGIAFFFLTFSEQKQQNS